MHRECELLLYGAARAQHVREKILPALDRGAVVLCDRFELATFAYQGFGRSIPLDLLERINGIATGGCKPDLTFVFDLPVAVALERLAATGKAPDRLEQESRTFFENVAAGFRTLAAKDPSHIMLLDARQPVEVIAETVYRRITELLQA
jgi:dTMP kinase